MDKVEVFQILGIEITKDESIIKSAYRDKLTMTNPEDDPEGFKQLRAAYEEACRLAKQTDGDGTIVSWAQDNTPSGQWVEKVAVIYENIRSRQSVEEWSKLFEEDCFLSLEEEENCRIKLLRFLMDHFRLPGEVWKLLDKKLSLTADASALREKFPVDFVRYVLNKCERGEDVEFEQFEGKDDAPYDLFLQYYDRCWQALQGGELEQAEQNIKKADELGIRHPVMEICRADLLEKKGSLDEAIAILEEQRRKYPKDAMICYNTAEMLWRRGDAENGSCRQRAVEIYKSLKEENDSHYMSNVRLTEWYYDNGQSKEAKKCAEKVLSAGSGEEFMELLGKVNKEIEKELEENWRRSQEWESALELCWCYLQDGKIAKGIHLATKLEKKLPPEKEAEWNGLMAKLYVEEAEYEDSITMTHFWEEALEKKLLTDEDEEEKEKDRDRLRQAHMIRMQCYHNLGFKEEAKFLDAIKEGEAILEGTTKDIGILLEMAQIYTEMKEYDRCDETVHKLVEDYQIYAAYATALEAYRRQLDAGGVVRSASQCIRYFPDFIKAYEYIAKVYLDLERPEDLKKVFEDAEKNGIKSDILEAYKYQQNNKPMGTELLNTKLKMFRKDFRKPLEEGKLSFYETGLPILTEYLYNCPDSYMFVERGIFHRAAHHYREARDDFEKAISLNPSNPYALNGLSFVYKYMGDYEKALFYIKKAILYMDSDMSPVIYTDMADLYSLMGHYDMALAACRQYEQITGESKSSWFGNELAECLIQAGRYDEAVEVYERFYEKDWGARYEHLVDLYIRSGQKEKAKEALDAWIGGNKASSRKYFLHEFKTTFSVNQRKKPPVISYPAFYQSFGWYELVFGSRQGVIRAFSRMMQNGLDEKTMIGKVGDAVFAAIVCGDKRAGARWAGKIASWLQRDRLAEGDSQFNREKIRLHLEVLSAWYTASDEKIRELLDKDVSCGICHTCTYAICKEMEGVHILYLLRQGRTEEAKERLKRNLERQNDEYMLAIKHAVFQDEI